MRKKNTLILLIICTLFACKNENAEQNNNKGNATTVSTNKEAKLPANSFKDERDGEIYKTIKIGNQVWMAENLRYKMEDSYLNPDNPNKSYGRLYKWKAAMEACPNGWHLPSDKEWMELERSIGMAEHLLAYDPVDEFDETPRGVEQNKALKSKTGWKDNKNGTDKHGFNVLPAGWWEQGVFSHLSSNAYYYTSTQYHGELNIIYRSIDKYDELGIGRSIYGDGTKLGFSCRCVQ